jgi:hypothetical protein
MSGKKPGLNLADLAPMSKDVPIGKSFLTVYGISARDGLRIFQRYPKILGMVGEGFDIKTFLSVAPEAVAAIIAASTGDLDNEQAELNAGRLGLETQFDILEAVGGLTFTNGFAPFVMRIMALADAVVPSAPSIKAPVMKSPPASKPSSQGDTTQT